MDATLGAAGIGAAAGLIAGLGSALATLRATRIEAREARARDHKHWQDENRRLAYSEVITSFRELMMAWWMLRDGGGVDPEEGARIKGQINAKYAAFTSACATVTLLAPDNVSKDCSQLNAAVNEFDKFAEGLDLVHRKRWNESDIESYENSRRAAERLHDEFIASARRQLGTDGAGTLSSPS